MTSTQAAWWLRWGSTTVVCMGSTGCDCAAVPKGQPTPQRSAVVSVAWPRATGDEALDSIDASADAPKEGSEPPAPRAIGPYETPFLGKRNVLFVVPPVAGRPGRLLANLHGMCNPPGYSCGYWAGAASERGFLVCPTGNANCGPEAYNAPTWTESFEKMDEDLETAIAVVSDRYPGEISREGAILTGFSKGATAAGKLATMHPGRWPYLILIEANVALSVPMLNKAKVRAVALIAGERGMEIGAMKATASALARQGYPARFWGMPKAGHFYSANIDQIMREAMQFLIDSGDGH